MLLSEQNDGADAIAQQAYNIYRGMKENGEPIPHWNALSREQRGLFEWVVRFARLQNAK